MDCPISEPICSPSGRNTGGIKAACSSLCVPALSGLLSREEIQRQRSNLHYKVHTAVQAWQFHEKAEKNFQEPLLQGCHLCSWSFGKNTRIQLCNLFCGEKVFSYADNLPIS